MSEVQELQELAASGRLMIITGAGTSLALAHPANPAKGWKQLIDSGLEAAKTRGKIDEEQFRRFQDALRSSDFDELLGAAEFVSTKLGGPTDILYCRWLEETFKNMKVKAGAERDAFYRIGQDGIPISTLNYDTLLEQATGLNAINYTETRRVMRWARREEEGIFHLHGIWSEPTSCVLSIKDYEKAVGDKFREALQRGLMSFNRLLFIGCGDTFNDPNFSTLLSWMRNVLGTASLQHYALIRDDQVAEKKADKLWSGFIDPIGYGPSYDDLPTFLDGIFGAASDSELRSSRPYKGSSVLSVSQTDVDFEGVRAESITREVAVGARDLRELLAVSEGVIGASTNKVAELSQRLGMTQGAALAVLRSLGHDDIPLDRLPDMLFAASTQLAALRQELDRATNVKLEIGELRQKAGTALHLGSFDKAVRLLNDVRTREREESERLHRSAADRRAHWFTGLKAEAETCALIARAFLAQGIVTNARARFAEGIELLAPVDPGSRWNFTVKAAQTLHAFGERGGSTHSLEGAVDFYRLALSDVQRELAPLQWSITQNNLGAVLFILGRWTAGTSRLDKAAIAVRASLEVISRDAEPRRWAIVQNNLGNVLIAIGERKGEIPALKEALTRYRAALEVNIREREPLGWALNSSNYASALVALGKIDEEVHWYQDAVKVYLDVLTVYSQKEYPLEWAQAQNNLGNALWMLGRRLRKAVFLKQAIAAFRSALIERTRERVPMNWATSQNNLGNALQSLAAIERGRARLKEAITAYDSALEERTRERVPLLWAETQNNLGYALKVLGSRTRGTELLEQAVGAYRAALEIRTPDGAPSAWRETKENLAVALRALEERRRK